MKNAISVIVMISLLLTAVLSSPVAVSAAVYPAILAGDVDGSGDVDSADATFMQRSIIKLATPYSDDELMLGDIDRSGELEITDVTAVQGYLVNIRRPISLEVELPMRVWDGEKYIPIEEDYQSYLDEYTEDFGFNGVVIATRNGRVLCRKAVGYSDFEKQEEITADTLFPIGSLSKQFCAAAVMLLQEQGKLSVTDTVDKYFPDYSSGKRITIQHLLSMTSGIKNYSDCLAYQTDESYPDDEVPDFCVSYKNTPEENKNIVLNWVLEQPLSFEPGADFDYSNSNYFLLSEIVAHVSEMDYTDFLKQSIFVPLGMDDTGFYADFADSGRIARNHPSAGLDLLSLFSFDRHQGSGDIISCAGDIDKWLTSLRTHKILTKESVAEMSTRHFANSSYGYGLFAYNDGTLCHGGSIFTHMSYAYTDPSYGFNLFAVSNAARFPTTHINDDGEIIDNFSHEVIDYCFEV